MQKRRRARSKWAGLTRRGGKQRARQGQRILVVSVLEIFIGGSAEKIENSAKKRCSGALSPHDSVKTWRRLCGGDRRVGSARCSWLWRKPVQTKGAGYSEWLRYRGSLTALLRNQGTSIPPRLRQGHRIKTSPSANLQTRKIRSCQESSGSVQHPWLVVLLSGSEASALTNPATTSPQVFSRVKWQFF